MNLALKSRIILKFGTQSDFSQKIKAREAFVSQVVCGRRTLEPLDQKKWAAVLDCKPKEIFK